MISGLVHLVNPENGSACIGANRITNGRCTLHSQNPIRMTVREKRNRKRSFEPTGGSGINAKRFSIARIAVASLPTWSTTRRISSVLWRWSVRTCEASIYPHFKAGCGIVGCRACWRNLTIIKHFIIWTPNAVRLHSRTCTPKRNRRNGKPNGVVRCRCHRPGSMIGLREPSKLLNHCWNLWKSQSGNCV